MITNLSSVSFARILLTAFVVTLAAILFIPANAAARQFARPDSAEIVVVSPDSLELVGYFYYPVSAKSSKAPLVILLHQSTQNHAVWQDFVDLLAANDIAAFALDLRGCGYSIFDHRTHSNRPPNTFYVGEQVRYPDDIAQLLGKLIATQGNLIDTTRIAVIGCELGANAGMIMAARDPRVKFVGLISPGLEYSGLRIAESLRQYGGRPLFIATSTKDTYSMESCNLLSDVVPQKLDLMIFDTYHYGSMLMATQPDLIPTLISRLTKHLKY